MNTSTTNYSITSTTNIIESYEKPYPFYLHGNYYDTWHSANKCIYTTCDCPHNFTTIFPLTIKFNKLDITILFNKRNTYKLLRIK